MKISGHVIYLFIIAILCYMMGSEFRSFSKHYAGLEKLTEILLEECAMVPPSPEENAQKSNGVGI